VRNPLRKKLLQLRFAPIAFAAALAFACADPSPALRALGAALVATGLALRAVAVGHLEKREILTVTGPYAHLRHPLYAGTLLVSLGLAAVLGGVVAGALAALTLAWFAASYFPRKERRESDVLEARFGGAFAAYRARVPAVAPALRAYVLPSEVARDVPLSSRWSLERYVGNNELGTFLGVALALALAWLRTRALLGAP